MQSDGPEHCIAHPHDKQEEVRFSADIVLANLWPDACHAEILGSDFCQMLCSRDCNSWEPCCSLSSLSPTEAPLALSPSRSFKRQDILTVLSCSPDSTHPQARPRKEIP